MKFSFIGLLLCPGCPFCKKSIMSSSQGMTLNSMQGTYGLMELGFRDPQLHTTVLPQLINMPILRTFLTPLLEGSQTSLTLRVSLNGIALDHRLVAAESGFYLSVNLEGSPHLCHKLSTWPSHTHRSCTDTLRYSPVGISIHTYSKTVVPQCIYREAIGLSSAGRST